MIFSIATSFVKGSLSFTIIMAALGLGPAILAPAASGILGSSFPPGPTKNIAFAMLGAGQPMGYIAGLILGGLLASRWHIIYWILGGLAAVLGTTSAFSLPADIRKQGIKEGLACFDWVGSLLSIVGATSLIFALADAETAPEGWSTPYISALLPTSVAVIVSFLWWEEKREMRSKHALMPLTLWKAKSMGSMVAVLFLSLMSFNTLNYFSTLMYQQVQFISPVRTSIYYLPLAISGIVLNILAGYLIGRLSLLTLIYLGLLGSVGACLAFSLLNPDSNYGLGMFWVMLLMPGPDLFFSPASILIQNSVSEDKQALAGSIFNGSTRLATSLGLALCSALSTATARGYSERYIKNFEGPDASHPASGSLSPMALLRGFRAVGWACLAATVLAGLIATIGLRDTGVVGKGHDEMPEGQTESEGVELATISGSEVLTADNDKQSTATLRARMEPITNS
ncbi:hypothetical protein FRC03_011673 [Tulasnella sp. 419]|nr:hypothetical protein FRC03_011673 [Tulasnella sp. 419]